MPAGKRASSAMDGKRKPIHGSWIRLRGLTAPEQICMYPRRATGRIAWRESRNDELGKYGSCNLTK